MFRQQIMTCISGTCIMQYLKLSVFVKKVIFQKKRWFLGIECKRQ